MNGRPDVADEHDDLERTLPAGWHVAYADSEDGEATPYYYNETSGETSWEPPSTDALRKHLGGGRYESHDMDDLASSLLKYMTVDEDSGELVPRVPPWTRATTWMTLNDANPSLEEACKTAAKSLARVAREIANRHKVKLLKLCNDVNDEDDMPDTTYQRRDTLEGTTPEDATPVTVNVTPNVKALARYRVKLKDGNTCDVTLGISIQDMVIAHYGGRNLSQGSGNAAKNAALLAALSEQLSKSIRCSAAPMLDYATRLLCEHDEVQGAVALLRACENDMRAAEEARIGPTWGNVCLRIKYGELLEACGMYGEAVRVYQDIVNISDTHPHAVDRDSAFMNLGVAKRRSGDNRGALECYLRVLQGHEEDRSEKYQAVRHNAIMAAGMNTPLGRSMVFNILGGKERIVDVIGPSRTIYIGSLPQSTRYYAYDLSKYPNCHVIYYNESRQVIEDGHASDLSWLPAPPTLRDALRNNSRNLDREGSPDRDSGRTAAMLYKQNWERTGTAQAGNDVVTICDVCNAHMPTKKCGGCGLRQYCSQACQKFDWSKNGHKKSCRAAMKKDKGGA